MLLNGDGEREVRAHLSTKQPGKLILVTWLRVPTLDHWKKCGNPVSLTKVGILVLRTLLSDCCTFCGELGVSLMRGAKANICSSCAELANEFHKIRQDSATVTHGLVGVRVDGSATPPPSPGEVVICGQVLIPHLRDGSHRCANPAPVDDPCERPGCKNQRRTYVHRFCAEHDAEDVGSLKASIRAELDIDEFEGAREAREVPRLTATSGPGVGVDVELEAKPKRGPKR